LLEATRKKALWLERTCDALGLIGVSVIAERAETLAHDASHRAAYDVAFARAVAPLATLCELCLPFVRVGGRFIAQKSAAGAAIEIPKAGRALALLGGKLVGELSLAHAALPNHVLV